ncbi:MAG TPA: DUF3300 domain-containing protein [Candidatus Polarisedimenticolaceae bacterium]|nr:DUF3300 domain-containing protein [Candidatus Polarisedimenticolaceae bacterium]
MKPNLLRFRRGLAIVSCAALLGSSGGGPLLADEPQPAASPAPTPVASPAPEVTKIPSDQLDSLVAPIALYPDPLLAQVLVASTYPLEIVQLQQWMTKHPELKDQALADEVAKQPWDPSIQSMAATPEVVKRLAEDIQWTTDLGNAFLAQQSDVMDAVQRMRKKAKDNGALESNEQQNVETKQVDGVDVIIVESSNPEVIYVPSYSPTVVYGPPLYPYPPIYYPPYPPGAAFVSFSFGVMWGAAVWGGSCCGCGWGGNDIDINVDNNFNRIEHNRNGDRGGGGRGGSGNKWQHNASHRGAAPYGDKATANKYRGSARGESRAGQPSVSNRAGGAGASNRAAGPGASNRAGGSSASNRAGGPGASSRAGGAGGDKIGNRSIPQSTGSRAHSGFGGGSRGYSGSGARASSSRGSSSMSRSGGTRGGGRGGRR